MKKVLFLFKGKTFINEIISKFFHNNTKENIGPLKIKKFAFDSTTLGDFFKPGK